MLFAVGMYLPLETTFAIFVGGLIRGFVDKQAASVATTRRRRRGSRTRASSPPPA